jgi:hypothetical protein
VEKEKPKKAKYAKMPKVNVEKSQEQIDAQNKLSALGCSGFISIITASTAGFADSGGRGTETNPPLDWLKMAIMFFSIYLISSILRFLKRKFRKMRKNNGNSE